MNHSMCHCPVMPLVATVATVELKLLLVSTHADSFGFEISICVHLNTRGAHSIGK